MQGPYSTFSLFTSFPDLHAIILLSFLFGSTVFKTKQNSTIVLCSQQLSRFTHLFAILIFFLI